MNEELQNALLVLINQATTFANDEIPEVLHQVLAWNLWLDVFWMVAGVIWFALVWQFYKRAVFHPEKIPWFDLHGDYVDGCLVLVIVSIMVSIMFSIALLVAPFEIAKILLAPKIYLIEYAAGLAR